jgi:hypothetical protein
VISWQNAFAIRAIASAINWLTNPWLTVFQSRLTKPTLGEAMGEHAMTVVGSKPGCQLRASLVVSVDYAGV